VITEPFFFFKLYKYFFPTVYGMMTTGGKISGQKQPYYSYQYVYSLSVARTNESCSFSHRVSTTYVS